MNHGWLYKDSLEDTEWIFSTTEPGCWVACKKEIVWAELKREEPTP